MSSRSFVVGITGASGAAYAPRLLELLGSSGAEIHLIITPWGRRLLKDELGMSCTMTRMSVLRPAAAHSGMTAWSSCPVPRTPSAGLPVG